jgi:hypothetical protein
MYDIFFLAILHLYHDKFYILGVKWPVRINRMQMNEWVSERVNSAPLREYFPFSTLIKNVNIQLQVCRV